MSTAVGIFTQTLFAEGVNIDPVTGIDTGGAPVTNLPEPLNPSDAATKAYIDNFLNGLTTPAPVEKTGQTTPYASGDDGDLQKGMVWPNPRFTDNGDGTVTDNLTGLIWLQDASCFNTRNWTNALADANDLADHGCGLTDGSIAGDWHLPNIKELQSLLDEAYNNPALSNATGTAQWTEGDPFSSVQSAYYWSSTTRPSATGMARDQSFGSTYSGGTAKGDSIYVWPVRSSQ